MTPATWKASDLVRMVRAKYAERQRYAVFEQVADGTGHYANSWIDVMVVCLWPSDKCARHAMEVKVSRGDLLKELNTPGKNEWARQNCHFFWYVAPKEIVASADEIPEGCGWLYPRGKQLCIGKQAQYSAAEVDGDMMIAALARSAADEARREIEARARTVIEDDPEVARLKAVEGELVRFITDRLVSDKKLPLGIRAGRGIQPDDVRVKLSKLLDGTAQREEAEHLRQTFTVLQDALMRSLAQHAAVALIGLEETDKAGRRLLDRYGGVEYDVALKKLKPHLRKRDPRWRLQEMLKVLRDAALDAGERGQA